jgi:MFS family permease
MSLKQLGLKENWQQFSLLVLVNAFVGGMVGMERSILPELAETEFHLAAKTAILSFIVVFGITKALTNYFAGTLANTYGRKKLLVIGWVFALPVPFLLIRNQPRPGLEQYSGYENRFSRPQKPRLRYGH